MAEKLGVGLEVVFPILTPEQCQSIGIMTDESHEYIKSLALTKATVQSFDKRFLWTKHPPGCVIFEGIKFRYPIYWFKINEK